MSGPILGPPPAPAGTGVYDFEDIVVADVEPSNVIRGRLLAEGRPVLLAFSCGKDSIAAWLALRDAGIPVVPYHMQLVPGLRFVEDSLQYFEDFFETPILRVYHPSFYRWLNGFVFQAPERLAVIDAAQIPDLTYEDAIAAIRDDKGLDPDTWVCDGVRAADSIVRRIAFVKYGAMKPSNLKVSPVWDWRVAHVRTSISDAGIKLPPDYEWFGRSFDGLDRRFLEPLKQNAPDDYERVLHWFPLAELELIRHGL